MHIYVYIYIYIHLYTYIYREKYAHIHTYICIYMYTYTSIYIYIHIYVSLIHILPIGGARLPRGRRAILGPARHVYIYIYIYIYIYASIYIWNIYTYIYVFTSYRWPSASMGVKSVSWSYTTRRRWPKRIYIYTSIYASMYYTSISFVGCARLPWWRRALPGFARRGAAGRSGYLGRTGYIYIYIHTSIYTPICDTSIYFL